jgi:hypothetical protein
MRNPSSRVMTSRRGFLHRAAGAGSLLCFCPFGGRALAGFGQDVAEEPFKADSKMTFEQVYHFAYAGSFIPILSALAEQEGREAFVQRLQETASRIAREAMAGRPGDDRSLAVFMRPLRKPNHFWKHVITFEVVEDTETMHEGRVTQCLWAKTFRKSKAEDIGYACICHPDFAAAEGFNPKMKLHRTKTLMQGFDCCDHRYFMET